MSGVEPVGIPLQPEAWGLPDGCARPATFLDRDCLAFEDTFLTLLAPVREEVDGVVEAVLAVGPQRSFHGLVWRARGEDAESFFVRPHRSGEPDAIQYTPVSNGISSWQLYHGPGHWAPVPVPTDRWFRLRVAFRGDRAEAFLDDLAVPILEARLVHPVRAGRVGLLVGGPGLHVARFAVASGPVALVGSPAPGPSARSGVIARWEVSDAFEERLIAGAVRLPGPVVAARSWTILEARPDGLADLARVQGIRDGRDTVLVRATVRSPRRATRPLQLGFSDRATVFLNGRAIFSADDAYRTRDYRFLGSIGYWYTLHLPLAAGENELAIAVTEELGGWGVQARFADED